MVQYPDLPQNLFHLVLYLFALNENIGNTNIYVQYIAALCFMKGGQNNV